MHPIQSSDQSSRKETLLAHTKRVLKRLVRGTGYDVVRYRPGSSDYPPDFTSDHRSIIRAARPYTMTSPERLYSLLEAVRYIVQNQIPGAVVECGVWRGGSMMAAALMLSQLDRADRELYLFDTFNGMPKPKSVDRTYDGTAGGEIFEDLQTGDDCSDYCRASLDEVQEVLKSSNYPMSNVHFIKGKVEETVPEYAPTPIALLRLDTDWYDSTKHELSHLFPRLSHGGVLIIDDYGHWHGCRKAVDEYFSHADRRIYLARIDYTGRIGIKTA